MTAKRPTHNDFQDFLAGAAFAHACLADRGEWPYDASCFAACAPEPLRRVVESRGAHLDGMAAIGFRTALGFEADEGEDEHPR